LTKRKNRVAPARAARAAQAPKQQSRYHRGDRQDRSNYTSYTSSYSTQIDENVFSLQTASYRRKSIELVPKSISQETYIDLLTDWEKLIVFATGPAGTGKTMMAVLAGLKALKEGEVQKIIITRPAVEVDEEKHGFLPGDLTMKMEPWTRPIFDVIQEYYSPRDVARMVDEQIIEISPLAYLRGRTFKNAWIIFDEAQNSTVNQMKMVLTRLGDNSKMVITGDLRQQDRKFVLDNGLKDFIERLAQSRSGMISTVDFGVKDIQRHPVVKEVLNLYGEE
jgi:phosphate starvation-inducible protein PhoH and related proteins